MDNNQPSEQREINQNFDPAPQPITSSQSILIQINQQGNPPQQENPSQQINLQINSSQQTNPPQQGYQSQQGNRPQQDPQIQIQHRYQHQQSYIPQQEYAQPVLIVPANTNINSVVVNQAISENNINVGRSPISIVCTHCRENVTTIVENKCNGAAFCFCCVSLFCIYACYQCSRGKDLSCTDSIHICPKCQQRIGEYNALY